MIAERRLMVKPVEIKWVSGRENKAFLAGRIVLWQWRLIKIWIRAGILPIIVHKTTKGART
jgi:hypothetical protein